MTVHSDGTSRLPHAMLVPLTTAVAVGLGVFLALVGGQGDAVAIGVSVGYFVVIQGVLRALSVVGTREAW
jgi:hypothetical protein